MDNPGYAYITGESYGLNTDYDFVTIKCNPSGIADWIVRYNGAANEEDIPGYGISVDGSGNVYVAGGTLDSAYNDDVVALKYNSSGSLVWKRTYNSPYSAYDFGNVMTGDNHGNLYIGTESQGVGTSLDFITIKYNTAGNLEWVNRYNGISNEEDIPITIVVNNQGQVYTADWTENTTSGYDMLLVKYNANGETLWTRIYNGPGNQEDKIWHMALDNYGHVYVAGLSTGISSGPDYATIKFSHDGIQQ